MKSYFAGALISLSFILSAGGENLNRKLANVCLLQLGQNARLTFQAASDQGFILVALQHCSVLINGQSASFNAGDYRQVVGRHTLQLAQSGQERVPLVLVKIISALQPLTIEAVTLVRYQELEDASSSNPRVLIAIDALSLRDAQNLAGEDEHLRLGLARKIELKEGQATWLQSGMHHLQNFGMSSVRFITIEW